MTVHPPQSARPARGHVQRFADQLKVGNEYAPGGYDLADPTAWCVVADVERDGDDVLVWHDPDPGTPADPQDEPASFDSCTIVFVKT